MITKEQYLELVKKSFKHTRTGAACTSNDVLFSNTFMSFLEEYFIRDKEIIDITHCYKRGPGTYYDRWDEEIFIKTILDLVEDVVTKICKNDKSYEFSADIYTISLGICKLLDLKFNCKCFNDKYKEFYIENNKFGYYGMPLFLDILNHFNKLDIIPESNEYGMETEKEIVFDMSTWKSHFPNSKQLSFYKDEFDNNWTEDDWTYNEDGTLNDNENSDSYFDQTTRTWIKGKTPHNYYDRTMYEIRQKTGCGCLRRVNIGMFFVNDAIEKYGYIVGFIDSYPIKKLKTSLGFSFYKLSGFLHSQGLYCDDVNLKKVIFPKAKPKNLNKMKTPREFIVFNNKTGFWKLPKLYYPEKYKNFVADILKVDKNIGQWSNTCVYAHSRTLCGDTYNFNIDDFPDITDIDNIASSISNMITRLIQNNCHIAPLISFSKINIDAKIKDKSFIKELNIITQEDIDKYCNSNGNEGIVLEYYK